MAIDMSTQNRLSLHSTLDFNFLCICKLLYIKDREMKYIEYINHAVD